MPFPLVCSEPAARTGILEAADVSGGRGLSQVFQLEQECPKHFWCSVGAVSESFAELRDPTQDFPARLWRLLEWGREAPGPGIRQFPRGQGSSCQGNEITTSTSSPRGGSSAASRGFPKSCPWTQLQLLLLQPKASLKCGMWSRMGTRRCPARQWQPSVAGQGQEPIWGSRGTARAGTTGTVPQATATSPACARALSPTECSVLEAGG